MLVSIGEPRYSISVEPGQQTLECNRNLWVIPARDVSQSHRYRYADATMLRVAEGQVKVSTVFLVSVALIAFVVLAIAIGVHAFLAGAGHYGPWEQIWAG